MKSRLIMIALIAIGGVATVWSMAWAISGAMDRHRVEARAECVKMCEPRLVEEFDIELGTCRCDKTDFNLPPRCEATCLPRLVKSWDRSRGTCECEPASTWGDHMKDPKEFHPLWFEDAGYRVDTQYKKFDVELPTDPHPHTPE